MPSSKIAITDFSLGAGYDTAKLVQLPDGTFASSTAICWQADTRFGYVAEGLRDSGASSGIAAGYLPITPHGGGIWHHAYYWQVTTNGTNTKVYRVEGGTGVLKETVNTAVATDMFSWTDAAGNIMFIVFYGSAVAFRYTVDDGANWVASNRTGNTKYGNYGTVRVAARLSAQVDYVVNPNLLYASTSMINGGAAATTSTTVGDGNTTDELFTSICEDDTGVELIGKEIYLYSIDSAGAVYKIAGPYPRPYGDGGGVAIAGILDRKNFENPLLGDDGSIYYHIDGGYDILRYYHGDKVMVGPRWQGDGNVYAMRLPVTAIGRVEDWILCATGSSKVTSIRKFTMQPNGNGIFLRSTILNFGYLFAGKWDGSKIVWHGSLTYPNMLIRGLWYDHTLSYLNIVQDDATTSQISVPFALADPIRTIVGGATGDYALALSGYVDIGFLTFGSPFKIKTPGRFKLQSTGISSFGNIAVELTPVSDGATWSGAEANSKFAATFASIGQGEYGVVMPAYRQFKKLNIEVDLQNLSQVSGAPTPRPVLFGLEMEASTGATLATSTVL